MFTAIRLEVRWKVWSERDAALRRVESNEMISTLYVRTSENTPVSGPLTC